MSFLGFLAAFFFAFLDGFGSLGEDEFDVARVGHVRVDAAVSSVGTATHGDGTVHLDVSDVQSFGFDTLDLGVTLGVLQQVEHVTARFFGPAASYGLVSLSLGVVTDTTSVAEERDGVLALENILEEALSLLQGQVLQMVGCVQGVLVVNTKVRHSGLDRLGRVFRFL